MSAAITLADDGPGWVSGSALAAAVNCAASAVLPRVLRTAVSATKIGSALHEHIRQRNLYGVASAVEMLPELAASFDLDEDESSLFVARAKAFEWSPPRGAIAELPLCLFEDGRVEVVQGGKGAYVLPPDALIPSQIDLFWAEPEPLYRDEQGRIRCPPSSVLWVVDFKSGKEDYVAPAERNAQALAGAMLAAKYTGAARVLPGIVYLRRGQGVWDVPDHYLDLAAVERVERALRDAVVEVRRQRARHREGLPLVYREGMHCNLCGARNACPAHLASLKAWLGDPAPVAPGALSDEQIRRIAELAPAFRRFAESVDRALREHVEASGRPIELSDGRVWGPHAKTVEVLDADRALAVLRTEVGDLADGALKRSITKSSVERVVKADHDAKGIHRKKAEVMRRFHAKLAEAGGIRKVTKVQWGTHKPRPELPAPSEDERAATIAALHGLPIDGDADDDTEDE